MCLRGVSVSSEWWRAFMEMKKQFRKYQLCSDDFTRVHIRMDWWAEGDCSKLHHWIVLDFEIISIPLSRFNNSHFNSVCLVVFHRVFDLLKQYFRGTFFDQNVLCNEHLANETQNSELNLTRSMSIMRYSHCQYSVKSFVIRAERQRQTRMKKRNDILEWDTISK